MIAFIGYLVCSYYAARNSGLAATERLYSAMRNSNEIVVKSSVTGLAFDKLQKLEAEYGKVLGYEITDTVALPADHWIVHLRVTRERARTVEEVSNVGSGDIISLVHGEADTQ